MIPLQPVPNGSFLPEASLNVVQGVRPRPLSPPTVKSQPYWMESTLSLLPHIPPLGANPSTKTNISTATATDVAYQNPRTSHYRKAAHLHTSNGELCRSRRHGKQKNSFALDTSHTKATSRPMSVCSPLPLPTRNVKACSSLIDDLGID